MDYLFVYLINCILIKEADRISRSPSILLEGDTVTKTAVERLLPCQHKESHKHPKKNFSVKSARNRIPCFSPFSHPLSKSASRSDRIDVKAMSTLLFPLHSQRKQTFNGYFILLRYRSRSREYRSRESRSSKLFEFYETNRSLLSIRINRGTRLSAVKLLTKVELLCPRGVKK